MFYNKKIETASRKKIKHIQNKFFKKALKRLYNNCQLYKEKVDSLNIDINDIKSIDDITKLPILNKSDLRNPKMNWSVNKEDVINIHRSSGTTGVPTNIPYTQNDINLWAGAVARSLACVGVTSDNIIQNSFGYGLKTGGNGINIGGQKLGAMVIPASTCGDKENLNILVDGQLRPDVLCCTPSYAEYLAEKIAAEKANGNNILAKLQLKIAVLGAEPWSENQREKIENELGVKAYDIYGLSEILGPGVAIECPEKQGLHIWEDIVYVEVLDPKTFEPKKEGEEGTLVLTCLQKEAYPLVRYNTGDICSVSYEKCKCGRTHARITRIKDRTDDMQIIRGVNIYPFQIEKIVSEYIKTNKELTSVFEIVVDNSKTLNQMIVRIEKKDTLTDIETTIEELEKVFKNQTGIKIGVELVEQNTLPRFRDKKTRIRKIEKQVGEK